MKRTLAAAIAISLSAGTIAPASANEFMDEERTIFDDPQCPNTSESDNEFLGKKQSIFDQCATQEKKPKDEKPTSSPAEPSDPASPSEATKPSEEAEPSEAAQPEKPEQKSPLSDADKEKLKEQVQGSVEGYKTVQPFIKILLKVLHIVRKIFIPFP